MESKALSGDESAQVSRQESGPAVSHEDTKTDAATLKDNTMTDLMSVLDRIEGTQGGVRSPTDDSIPHGDLNYI